jgi:solute carrier family 35 protein E3
MKTVCVLILGWILFDSSLSFKNVLGMMMAILGMVLYSSAMEVSKQASSKAPPLVLKGMNFGNDEDASLLKSSLDVEGGKLNSN